MKKPLLFSVICLGFTAMASQIVFIREFLAVFSGDELSIGIIVAGWTICGAVGALLLTRLADNLKHKILIFALSQIFLSIFLPIGIVLVRLVRPILGIQSGQILPFYMLVFSSVIILLPLCGILGFMFILSCRMLETSDTAYGISLVYAVEALGSMMGGCIATLILVRYFNSLTIMAMLGILNAGAAFLVMEEPGKKAVQSTAISIILLLALLWPFNGWKKLDIYSVQKQWPGYEVLDVRSSLYAHLVSLKRENQISFYNNGMRLFSVPDTIACEEAAHFCLLEHKEPKDILLIGGGAGGLLDEILKHPVAHVDYVELDPALIVLARDFLAHGSWVTDTRVSVRHVDGRYFIKTTGNTYDCIIINLGDPYTAQLNRFYTTEFFREAKHVLKKNGIISFGMTSSESYINPDLAKYLGSVYATLKKEFSDVKVIPGTTAHFLATDSSGTLTYDYKLLMQRAVARKLDLQYVREYYLFSRMAPDNIKYTENALQKARPRLNVDFRPSSYYYAIIYWSSQFRNSFMTNTLRRLSGTIIWPIAVVVALCISLFVFRNRMNAARVALAGVCVMGFSQAGIQIALLFSFQIIYGNLYDKLGLIFTFFMLGLALSGWRAGRPDKNIDSLLRNFCFAQASIAIYAFLFQSTVVLLSRVTSVYALWFGANMFFPALSFIAGLQGGALFALANRMRFLNAKDRPVSRSAGLIYGVDLIGSCAGAVVCAVCIIPVLGLTQNCMIIGLLNLSVVLPFLYRRDII